MSNQDGKPTRPYWKRMHQDWRVWIAVFLMLVAMMIYIMTDYLAWFPPGAPHPPPTASDGSK
jgi:hypothetical protein